MATVPTDWAPPPRRSGLAGVPDWLIGPGANAAETAVVLFPAAAAAITIAAAGLRSCGWSRAQAVFGGALAFDVVGGAVANATTPAKRWYHRRGTSPTARLAFVATHGVHIAAVAAVWRRGGVAGGAFPPAHAAGILAALLMAGAAVAVGVPRRLQRPVAVTAVVAAVVATATDGGGVVRLPRGMGWFVPTLALKLLAGHLVTEEPYVGDPPVGGDGGGKEK